MNTKLISAHWCRRSLFIGLVLATGVAQAETLVVGTNQPVNLSLTVATNQALVVYGGDIRTSASDVYWRITQFGSLHLFRLDSTAMQDPILKTFSGRPNILAGPLTIELFIPMTSEVEGSWMSYQIMPLEGLNTLILGPSETNTITVPSGKNLRMVSRRSGDRWGIWVYLLSGNSRARISTGDLEEDSLLDPEFTGPMELEIENSSTQNHWFTYSLHSVSVQVTPQGAINSSGISGLVVEESSDLERWSATAVMLKDAVPKKFYRLKVSK